ncbi:DUF7331 family protein [Natronosalvus halobius]|uniref:DUF7331 family protein n=1 Tax=Natronosalvus halobius TaxID=2953746 RepID=UPI00209C8DF5|nr:hypothetical protein [Natronosalvus halobius]USZ70368.1 hypothetical protein NGM15_09565 [Natronosalvus halobius]
MNDDTTDGGEPSGEPAGTATIECYETDDGTVFYDAENPLAWMETTQTFSLEEVA